LWTRLFFPCSLIPTGSCFLSSFCFVSSQQVFLVTVPQIGCRFDRDIHCLTANCCTHFLKACRAIFVFSFSSSSSLFGAPIPFANLALPVGAPSLPCPGLTELRARFQVPPLPGESPSASFSCLLSYAIVIGSPSPSRLQGTPPRRSPVRLHRNFFSFFCYRIVRAEADGCDESRSVPRSSPAKYQIHFCLLLFFSV